MTKLENQTCLVTGGAGYIGSHTSALLRSRGMRVVIFDTLEFGLPEGLKGVEIVKGDVRDRSLLRSVCTSFGVGAVIHFAAYKNVGESHEKPTTYLENNVGGLLVLLDVMGELDIKRLVFSSSCSVVGTPTRIPVKEEEPRRPESTYALTKSLSEIVLEELARRTELRYVILRYFNAAGAALSGDLGENWTHSKNLIPRAFRAALTGDPVLNIYGVDYPTRDGSCVRDYVHVDDVARAHIAALEFLEDNNESAMFNIGTGIGTSVLEILRAVEDVTGLRVPVLVSSRRDGDPAAVFADSSRANEVLGWTAKHDLSTIIQTSHAWYRRSLNSTT